MYNHINAIAISNTNPLDIENYFKINFNELNESINKLADRTTALTNDDKKLANEIINTWNKTVVDSINEKILEIEQFCESLDLTNQNTYLTNEEIEAIAKHVKCEKEYSGYMLAMQKTIDAAQALKDIDEKYEAIDECERNKEILGHYSAERYAAMLARRQAEINARKTTTILFTKLSKTPEVKSFMKKGHEFLSQATKLKQTAVNKANLARVNVTIDNVNVRDALFELMNFSI